VLPTEGIVYIADFDFSKVFIYKTGSGSTPGDLMGVIDGVTMGFTNPVAVFVYKYEVYIAEWGNGYQGHIIVTDLQGNFHRKWPYYTTPYESAHGFWSYTAGGLYVYNQEVYVPDATSYVINVYDLNGNLKRTFDAPSDGSQLIYGQHESAIALGFMGANLYVGYITAFEVLDPSKHGTQTPILKWGSGSGGSGDGQFFDINSMVVVADNLFVCDTGNFGRITEIDRNGNYITKFGIGTINGYGIDEYQGELYIASRQNQGVKVFSTQGDLHREWIVTTGRVWGIGLYKPV
jgi:hypothetical protein